MSIKLALLKSGENIIADIKELISDDKTCGYLFTNPHVLGTRTPFLLSEENELQVYTEFGKLYVQGTKEESKVDGSFVHKGLAQRSFKRVWTISDDTKVGSVKFEDGLLTVQLNKIVPEHHARKEYL